MADFLDRSRELYAEQKASAVRTDAERVFGAISKLKRVHSNADIDLVNLESVFGAFEMASLLDIEPAQDKEVLTSFRRLIAWTLNQTITFPAQGARLVPHSAYSELAKLIRDLEARHRDPLKLCCSVITFNWTKPLCGMP